MEKVPCPPDMQERCPIFVQEGECYEDRHHIYWPAPDYRTKTEKEFRELEINKVTVCRWLHNTLHALSLPPEKPTPVEMRKKTSEHKRN